MTSQDQLVQQKKILMNEMLNQLSNWDQSMDEALRIVTENNESIELMQAVDAQLTEVERIGYNGIHKEVWKKIIQKQEELTRFIRSEKDKKEEQLIQMGNKEKVVSSYIDIQKKSGFIRRNY